METFSPIALALLIVLTVALAGVIVSIIRHDAIFRSYEDLRAETRAIARGIRGEVHRDGKDLVVAGARGQWPLVVRFSYAENTPGLGVRMEAPAGFTLWMTPRSAQPSEGQAQLRTGDSRFDAQFATRSNHPTQANMLLMSKPTAAALQRLCCSTSSSVAITTGVIELTELVIPRPYTADHVLEHITDMAQVAAFLKTMPGAERIKVAPLRREYHLWRRIALAAGIAAAILVVVAAGRKSQENKPDFDLPATAPGLLPAEAAVIPGTFGWRLATASDFDPDAAAWVRGYGLQVSGRVNADFSGNRGSQDSAYTLMGVDGSRRLVLVAGGVDRYDVKLPYVGLIARVPKSALKSIQWVGKAPQDADGDGLLILRKAGDPASGVVLFLSGTHIVSGVPVNYQAIPLLD